VIAASGLLTVGALRAFQALKLSVPDDIAFVTFDEMMNSEFFTPRLTCFIQPVEAIGRAATQLLETRLADADAPPRAIRVPGALFHGDSCGCGGRIPLTLLPSSTDQDA